MNATSCAGTLLTLVCLSNSVLAEAEPDKNLPNPSSIVLKQDIPVLQMKGNSKIVYKIGGTVSLAIQEARLNPDLISKKPSIVVSGVTGSGEMVSQGGAYPAVAAVSHLSIPYDSDRTENYVILQYPFQSYINAKAEIRWICASSDQLKECVDAPSLNEVKPYEVTLPESHVEITSLTIITEKAGVDKSVIAVAGVVELVISEINGPFPIELPVKIYTSNASGNTLDNGTFRARLFFLRPAMVPNPHYKPGFGLPYVSLSIPLYEFSGYLPLTSDLLEVHALLEHPSYSAERDAKKLHALDANHDGYVDEVDDLNGDGLVNSQDWQGGLPNN